MRGVFALLLAIAGPALAAPVPSARPTDELTIEFLSADAASPVRQAAGGEAMLDVGRLGANTDGTHPAQRTARHRGAETSIVTPRRIAILLRSNTGRGGFARLRAFVAVTDPRCRVEIDGIALSQSPQLIDPAAPVGRAVAHTLSIEVPASEPPGALDTRITWLAETDL
jgi:hypothetical protein